MLTQVNLWLGFKSRMVSNTLHVPLLLLSLHLDFFALLLYTLDPAGALPSLPDALSIKLPHGVHADLLYQTVGLQRHTFMYYAHT